MIYVFNIIKNIMTTVYEKIGPSLLVAVLSMFTWLYFREHGAKSAVRRWLYSLRKDKEFRKKFLFILYTAMMLFRTLFAREIYPHPLENVTGIWSLHREDGSIYTENIENVILFVPFTLLLMWNFAGQIFSQKITFLRIAGICTGISAICSLAIETSQLVFFLGTFQLTDLLFNTVGGLIGGSLYWGAVILSRHRKNI